MGLSDYLENKILDHVLGGGDYARPATVYAALFTSAPTDAGGGTEAVGGSYARAAITNNSANFPAAAGGAKSNAAAISFAPLSATIGTIVAVGIFDALAAGNLLFWATLASPKPTANGDTLSFPIGNLSFTAD